MDYFPKVQKFVEDSFKKANSPGDILHHERIIYWIKELEPNPSEALLIAGAVHDIERAFNGDWKKGSINNELLQKHQNLSTAEIEKFLKHEKADEKLIEKVKHLVAHHETGGDKEQNILCDADALVYFETKILRHAENYKNWGMTKDDIKNKFKHEWDRISSEKAKSLAKPFYDTAIKKLEE